MKDLFKVLLGALVGSFLMVCLTEAVRAQTCTPQWTISGSSFTGTQQQACAETVVRYGGLVEGATASLGTCTLDGSTLHAQVNFSNGASYDVTSAMVTGCSPDPSSSSPAPTSTTQLKLPDGMELSPEDGSALAWQIVSVWAMAWAIRVLILAIPALKRDEDE